MSTYRSSDQLWLAESLNWEKISSIVSSEWSPLSFLTNSSFLNQHFFIDHISKLSFFDAFLVTVDSAKFVSQTLYGSFVYDLLLETVTLCWPIVNLFHTEYQELFSTLLLLSPELSTVFTEYANLYYLSNSINYTPSAVFDSYVSSNNFFFSEGIFSFLIF